MSESDPDFDPFGRIQVPITWAGVTREASDGTKVWTCGACAAVDACLKLRTCQRASQNELERGL
jgi:hypothetical protein